MIFRFDDVSINTDIEELNAMTDLLISKGWDVMWAVSIMTHKEAEKGRVFPKEWSRCISDFDFFRPNQMGIPSLRSDVIVASHGLIHINHRYLTEKESEMSITISCALLNSMIFVPPFGQYQSSEIVPLMRFENAYKSIEVVNNYQWQSAEHEPLGETLQYYAHSYAFGLDKLTVWLK